VLEVIITNKANVFRAFREETLFKVFCLIAGGNQGAATAPWNPTASRASRLILQTTIDVNVNAMKAHPCASMAFISSTKWITHQLLIFRA